MWFGGQDPANFFNTNTWTVPITVYCNGEWRSSVLIKSGSQAQGMEKKKYYLSFISLDKNKLKYWGTYICNTKSDSRRVITV